MTITKLSPNQWECKIGNHRLMVKIDSQLKSHLNNIAASLNKKENELIGSIAFNRFKQSQNALNETILHYTDKDILKLINKKN